MARLPDAVARAADGFRLRLESLRPLGRRSGATWSDGHVVLRVGERVASELPAMAAAAGHVPRPARARPARRGGPVGEGPGRPAGEVAFESPRGGAAAGHACGALHDALAQVPCPPGLRDAPGARSGERRLLHLDLHPVNVLVDDDGAPTGVIDWANTAGGAPELDRARTWTLLTLDPAVRELEDKRGWKALADAWLQAGRLQTLSGPARRWACQFMLEDLAARHTRAELAHVRRAMRLAGAER